MNCVSAPYHKETGLRFVMIAKVCGELTRTVKIPSPIVIQQRHYNFVPLVLADGV